MARGGVMPMPPASSSVCGAFSSSEKALRGKPTVTARPLQQTRVHGLRAAAAAGSSSTAMR